MRERVETLYARVLRSPLVASPSPAASEPAGREPTLAKFLRALPGDSKETPGRRVDGFSAAAGLLEELIARFPSSAGTLGKCSPACWGACPLTQRTLIGKAPCPSARSLCPARFSATASPAGCVLDALRDSARAMSLPMAMEDSVATLMDARARLAAGGGAGGGGGGE